MKPSRIVLAIGALALVVLACCSFVRIGPDEVGVRADNLGESGRGIVDHDFGPGLHLAIPFVHTWTIFPARVRRVEMTQNPMQRSALGTDALLVQSSDGDRVMLDLAILFRIHPGDAHRLLTDSGTGDAHVRVLTNRANERLRATFGTLHTEEFYDAGKRHEKTLEALKELRAALAPRWLDVVDLMIEDVAFDPKYEQKIHEKKLADQSKELTAAQARTNTERAHVEQIKIDTDKQKKVIATAAEAEDARIKAEANKAAAEKRGDADLYRNQLLAKGNAALAHAEAQVNAAKTDAMSGDGGANYVALEAVQNLNIGSVLLPTTSNDPWFDVNEMARKLGAKQ